MPVGGGIDSVKVAPNRSRKQRSSPVDRALPAAMPVAMPVAVLVAVLVAVAGHVVASDMPPVINQVRNGKAITPPLSIMSPCCQRAVIEGEALSWKLCSDLICQGK